VIKGSVELIQRSLQNSNIIVNPYAQQRSPLRLTGDGSEMVKSVGIDRMIDENWTNIRSYMKKNLSTDHPYDIQQFLMEQTAAYPGKFINKDDLDRLKNIAYNKGYPLNVYLTVVALLIRDRYFSENNIDIEEIDKNDPQKVD
jgi:hypothetical protein